MGEAMLARRGGGLSYKTQAVNLPRATTVYIDTTGYKRAFLVVTMGGASYTPQGGAFDINLVNKTYTALWDTLASVRASISVNTNNIGVYQDWAGTQIASVILFK